MRRFHPLLWLSVGLDLGGLLVGVWLAAVLREQNRALLVQPEGFIVVLSFLLLAWFFGGYSFLRWPWMSYRRLVQRWLWVLTTALLFAVSFAWLLNVPESLIWFHRSTLLIAVTVMGVWGCVQRRCLQLLARRHATRRASLSAVATSPSSLAHQPNQNVLTQPRQQRELLILLVAYHPSLQEVEMLQACLSELTSDIGYAVVVNDYQPGEPVDQLKIGADCFLTNLDNPGYGRAVNRLVLRLGPLPRFIGVLNTDLVWSSGTFETLLNWMCHHPEVCLAVPQILDETGEVQKLCKQNPTLLGLFSRRFVPDSVKPRHLRQYDRWYVMADQDYYTVFEAPYLSGCCMLMNSGAFCRAGGFDERFFLYLEDADLTRRLALEGRCVHLPVASVTHNWGRGNYKSFSLMIVNFISAWSYFRKWGWSFF